MTRWRNQGWNNFKASIITNADVTQIQNDSALNIITAVFIVAEINMMMVMKQDMVWKDT